MLARLLLHVENQGAEGRRTLGSRGLQPGHFGRVFAESGRYVAREEFVVVGRGSVFDDAGGFQLELRGESRRTDGFAHLLFRFSFSFFFVLLQMLKTFPKRKLIFVPKAYCKTTVPETFKVLLSQRRRWINSTVHNLMELVLVRELCGTFCFSMQFVVFMELVGTVVLPAAITFT